MRSKKVKSLKRLVIFAFCTGRYVHPDVKPLSGFHGAGVLEVVENHDGDTYRAVYTVKFENIVFVLHCFQKKSKKGISTPKVDIDLIKSRLDKAKQIYEGMKNGKI
ncbi:type II toxin-antitoxin system RelE/ParE family toxin [Photorhabdus viridis]|uniref:type II toxin-antitoxin system RelE/ParE family toxin n=1 Tax=Photorhabdus viridis TaxID=3163327 RepID=UPI0033077B8A